MKVYRLSKTEYANDLSGTGAKLFGGRWNHINVPCLYTAASRALAVLEYSVNVNIEFIPKRLSIAVFEIDESCIYHIKKLPDDWVAVPSPFSTKDLGSNLLRTNTPIIEVPSVVIPTEFNYLLNPSALNTAFSLVEVQEFTYDLRIKKT